MLILKIKPSQVDLKTIKKLDFTDPRTILATWFGLGLLNPAPGTWGTIGALPFGLIILSLGGLKALIPAIIIITIIGYWSAAYFEKQTDSHDNKMIVIDEVAGMWIALCAMTTIDPLQTALAFVLFRLFDITKPWPISYLDKKVGGALGVMADDILAGIVAAICLWGIINAGII